MFKYELGIFFKLLEDSQVLPHPETGHIWISLALAQQSHYGPSSFVVAWDELLLTHHAQEHGGWQQSPAPLHS